MSLGKNRPGAEGRQTVAFRSYERVRYGVQEVVVAVEESEKQNEKEANNSTRVQEE